jgi:hypothetical protein
MSDPKSVRMAPRSSRRREVNDTALVWPIFDPEETKGYERLMFLWQDGFPGRRTILVDSSQGLGRAVSTLPMVNLFNIRGRPRSSAVQSRTFAAWAMAKTLISGDRCGADRARQSARRTQCHIRSP